MSDVARIHYEIPDELHRQVKAQAALRGMTLKDYLIAALEASLQVSRHPGAGKGRGDPTA